MHVPAVGKRALQHYGRWLIDTHGIDATKGFSPLLAAEPGGETGAPETRLNPIPRDWYHTDWVADRTIAYLDSLPDDADWFVWMSFPDPHHPWDPPQSELHRCNWRDLDLPARPSRRRTTRSSGCSRRSPRTGSRSGTVSGSTRRAAPARYRPQNVSADNIREINAMTPHHERARSTRRAAGCSPRVAARGWGDEHRRVLHDRSRRAARRLRARVQGPVPHRLAHAAPDGVAAGAVGRCGARGRAASRWASSTSRPRSARSRACPCRNGRRARRSRPRPARVASACSANGTRSFPATACTCDRSTATDGSAPCTRSRRSANRTAWRSGSPQTGMFGGGIGPVSASRVRRHRRRAVRGRGRPAPVREPLGRPAVQSATRRPGRRPLRRAPERTQECSKSERPA